jgi:hypothetical protein
VLQKQREREFTQILLSSGKSNFYPSTKAIYSFLQLPCDTLPGIKYISAQVVSSNVDCNQRQTTASRKHTECVVVVVSQFSERKWGDGVGVYWNKIPPRIGTTRMVESKRVCIYSKG